MEASGEACDSAEGFLEGFDGGGVGATEEAFTGGAEGGSWDSGDIFLLEESEGEIFAGEAEACDFRESVEGAGWGMAGEVHLCEGGGDEVTAAAVFGLHGGDGAVVIFEGFCGGALTGCWGGHDGILVKLGHIFGDFGWGAGVTDTEAGHGPSFGHTVEEDGTRLHLGDCDEGVVWGIVGQFGVDFVGEEEEVVLDTELRDFVDVVMGEDGAGGVTGEIEEEGACFWG